MSDKLNSGNLERDTTHVVNTGASSRRSFLKKSATGAVIMSLPAKSVWGACSVSGAMSGNLSQNTTRHDCEMPALVRGRSPGYWRHNGKYHGAFTKHNRRDERCLVADIQSRFSSNMLVSGASGSGYDLSYTEMESLMSPGARDNGYYQIGSALGSQGSGDGNLYFHLAAVYLNHFYGMYAKESGGVIGPARSHMHASRYVVQILLYVVQNPGVAIDWNMDDNAWSDSDYEVTTNEVIQGC